jgi:two-component system response regulator (stage 0 sporulation protein A)
VEKIKVCVADDNRELVGLLSEYIEGQEDMEVLGVAYNGQECLSLFKDKEPDVLVLDIIMPHLDGLAVLERLRESELKKQPNVIMLTAFGQEDVTKKAVDLGASYFILKPFDMENLSRPYPPGQRKRLSSVTHRAPSIAKQCPSQQPA